MGTWAGFDQGWQLASSGLNLAMALSGLLLGTLIGSLPRLSAIHGVSLFLPLAYTLGLPVESTLILLLSIYYAAEFGQQKSAGVSSGEPRAPTQTGHLRALSFICSFLGGLTAVAGLVLLVFLLKQLALRFGPADYFALVLFAFVSLSIRAGKYPLRTLGSTLIGVMLATIGIDSTTGVLRFTLGEPQLYDGIEFTTVVIGLFVVSELFTLLFSDSNRAPAIKTTTLSADWTTLLAHRWTLARAAFFGFLIGILPGTGSTTASSLSVKVENKLSSSNDAPGFRREQELVATEAANSAAVGGAMVPLLSLGIPGSGTTAILLGAILLYNITPGPSLFVQHSALVWALALSMCLGHLFLLFLYWPLSRLSYEIQRIPDWILAPTLTVLAFAGVFSVNESSLSLLIMLVLGLFAYLLERWHYPLVPVLLGFVLGDLMENSLRRALAISGGEPQILFASPISMVLWGLSVLILLLSLLFARIRATEKNFGSD